MRRIFLGLVILGFGLLFVLGGVTLDWLGWRYTLDDGPFITKIHPATYILVIAALFALFHSPYRVIQLFTNRIFLLYLAATFILLLRAILFQMGGVTGGELTMVLTNFVTTGLALICATCLTPADLAKGALPIRGFFVVNSFMALAERAQGHRFIPSFLDTLHEPRAAALVAHPLNGSLLTGLMIVHLVTARRGAHPVWHRLPELVLHGIAMFAFGGRSAIVFTPTILLLSAILGRNRTGLARLTIMQRALPLAVLALGIGLIFLPIPFVDQTLDRFSNDNDSANTRNGAMQFFMALPKANILAGIDINQRMTFAAFFHTAQGIELSWLAIIITFGLAAALPMMIAFPLLLYQTSRSLDRSAFYMAAFFLVVTAGSLSIGSKSLLVAQCFVMMFVLSQHVLPVRRVAEPEPSRERPDEDRFVDLFDT